MSPGSVLTSRWMKPVGLSCLFAFGLWRFATWPEPPLVASNAPTVSVVVARVIDGDTIELTSGERVRLIGIDTPELGDKPQPLAVEAKRLTRRLVEGREVRLQFDRERFDKYRRVLAFVHSDAQCLNEELVRAGMARVMTRFRYNAVMKKRLKAAEEEARAHQRGIWSSN